MARIFSLPYINLYLSSLIVHPQGQASQYLALWCLH